MTPEDTAAEGTLPETSAAPPLESGTLVEIRKTGVVTYGIVLSGAYYDKRTWTLSLTPNGEVVQHVDADVFIEIPRVVPRDLALRAGHTASPLNQTEVMARVEILRRLREIENAVIKAYNVIGHNNKALYPLVRAKHPDEWATISLPAAADLIADYQRGTFTTLLAVHKYLMARPTEFVADVALHRLHQTFEVRPQSHIDKLEAVALMLRQRSPTLHSFIDKARHIIHSNKQCARESWDDPLSVAEVEDVIYTTEDRAIIDVLRHALRRSRDVQQDPYSGVVASIIKKLNIYEFDRADESVLREALVDLGEFGSWDDLVTRRRELNLDHRPEEESPKVIAQNEIVKQNLSLNAQTRNPTAPLGDEDFYIRDPVGHLRHDFGDLPVYVVDDVGAEELDDGLSVEAIPSEPGSAWVHVHIADPTSIIPPTHVFARQAREMGTTAYFIPRTWPMLPTSLTHQKLSLGTVSRSGQPEPVLTFSFKIDAEGSIADWTVRAGLVRNIMSINYDDVDSILGYKKLSGAYPFGSKPSQAPTVSRTSDLDDLHVGSLRLLDVIARRHRLRNRQFSDPFNFSVPKVNISVSPKPLPEAPSHSWKPAQFRGFPDVTYEVKTQYHDEYGSRLMIAEFMKSACRIASRWLSAKGVPMLRRVSRPPIALNDSAFEQLASTRDDAGYVDYYAALKSEIYMPPVDYTLDPGMHWSLGVPAGEGYIRVTSPLRRYSDLLAHWQIKSALLSSGSSPASHFFSPEWLMAYGKEALLNEKSAKRGFEAHRKHWAYMYLKRWVEHPRPAKDRPDPLSSISGRITSSMKLNRIHKDHHWSCILPDLGVSATLASPRARELEIGEEIHNMKIDKIRLGYKPMIYLSQT
ncbi:RNB-domain-containing protein [Leucogyrophana mollusca]|uniref:RNB-domain-containing protein n=1 Tax=Leucogyrophana mollusca TaxID=85980 RepID=A0ACB8BK27_9AGAM|nr:RNB-domain-containing protein [Leucogyrophana mollusca]